jgi:hypothetical protein
VDRCKGQQNTNGITLIADFCQKLTFKKCVEEIDRPSMHRVRAAGAQHIKQCFENAFKK